MKGRVLGVDLGIRAPSVGLVGESGQVIGKALRFELSVEQLEQVERCALAGAPAGTQLHVVMEKTAPTCEYVSGFFLGRGHQVSFAKTDQVKEFRKCWARKVKTDQRDAYVLMRLPDLDPQQLERGYVATPALRTLKRTVSQRASMVQQLVRLKNQFIGLANTLWPGLSQVFGDLDSGPARSFLREQTPEQVWQMPSVELAKYLKSRGPLQQRYATRLAKRLLILAQRARQLYPLLAEQEIELTRTHCLELLEMIEDLEERIQRKERTLQQAFLRCDPQQHLTSIPGIAKKTGPTLCSYFGQPERFPTTRKAQGYVGLFPETDASANRDRKGTRITKQGPALLRRDLFLAADHFRRLDPQGAQLYYDQMVHKGKHHNSALCVVANRMLIPRILRVMREHRPYELRDFDGKPIDKTEARRLAAQFTVPEQVRQRLRSQKKQPANKRREGSSPPITSRSQTSRNGTPSRQPYSNLNTLEVTQEQLAAFVFRSLDQWLNSSDDLEEIRLQLRHQSRVFFKKGA
jgi:transposase